MDIKRIFSTKVLPVFLHAGFWLFFASTLFFLRPPTPVDAYPEILPMFVFIFFIQIHFFYLNAYYLIPQFLYNRGGFAYFLSVVVTGLCIHLLYLVFGHYWLPKQLTGGAKWQIITMPIFFMWAISTSYRLLLDSFRKEQERKEQENERLKSELSFLRSQISPHFMFNVLNSIVSLARKKSDKVEPVVIQLSELMRYMLYESDDTQVSLSKEIRYLQSYVDLQQIRFGNSITIIFRTENIDSRLLIEPMLLIPFVENAFKHGVGMIENPTIEIQMYTAAEHFYFQVRNKTNTLFSEEKDKSSGIGLANVERRLKLLYPNDCQWHVVRSQEWYTVDLTIRLKKEIKKNSSKTLLPSH